MHGPIAYRRYHWGLGFKEVVESLIDLLQCQKWLGDNRNGCGAFPMAKVPREILKFNAFKAGQGTAS